VEEEALDVVLEVVVEAASSQLNYNSTDFETSTQHHLISHEYSKMD
jgi:hypothetical protein